MLPVILTLMDKDCHFIFYQRMTRQRISRVGISETAIGDSNQWHTSLFWTR